MVLTDEEMIGRNQLLEYIYVNRTTPNVQDSQTAVVNIFCTLIQYPSILSKHATFRNAVQEKINEFTAYSEFPQHVVDLLQQVQLLLNNLPQRIDYIE
jgi:hypothetical protein